MLTGQLCDPTLVGNPCVPFRTHSRSPPGMALLLQPKTNSRSIIKPELLSSISLDEMRLLPLTQSSLILQPLLMDPPWPNVSVAETPWSVMHMASRVPSNPSTPWLIISGIGEPCTPLSVKDAPMKSPRRSWTSSDHSLLLITCLNPIISTKTRMRIDGKLPRDGSTRS